jgi:phage-related minor tail protein
VVGLADRIKGITVVLGGDTTGLSKALSGVNKEISSTQKQLKDVERLLKLDPTNTKLLEQRQRLLSDAVQETKTKLDTLKTAEKQVQEQFKRGEVSQQQYDALQREIAATAVELKNLESQAKKSDAVLAGFTARANAVSEGAAKISNTFRPATAVIGGLAAAAVATIPATEELRTDLSKLSANAKENAVNADIAREAWRAFAVQSGETDSAVEATSNLLQAGFTESNLQKAVEGLAGAAQRFPDTLKIESLADSLQETLATGKATGQFAELLDRLGIGAENFSQQLARCSSDAQKQNLVLRTLAEEGLNDTYNAWVKNNEAMLANKEANLRFQEAMAELAEVALPLVTEVTNALANLISWFSNLSPAAQNAIIGIALAIASISPVASMVSKVSGAIGALAGIMPVVGGGVSTFAGGAAGAMGGLSAFVTKTAIPAITSALSSFFAFLAANPVVLVIAAVTAAVVALVALIAKKGDEIQALLQKFNNWLQSIFVKDWTNIFGPVLGEVLNVFFANIKNIWDSIKKKFDGIIDFIRGVFTGDWGRAWKGVVGIFKGIIDGIVAIAKAPFNAVIGLVNGVINALNKLIRGLNKIHFDIPDWVPGLGGKSFGINIPTIGKIPYLAKGGVLSSGSAVVGEAGPELLTMSGGRAVVEPLTGRNQTTNLGGVKIYVYGAPGQDVNDLADIIMDKMEFAVQRKGAVYGA